MSLRLITWTTGWIYWDALQRHPYGTGDKGKINKWTEFPSSKNAVYQWEDENAQTRDDCCDPDWGGLGSNCEAYDRNEKTEDCTKHSSCIAHAVTYENIVASIPHLLTELLWFWGISINPSIPQLKLLPLIWSKTSIQNAHSMKLTEGSHKNLLTTAKSSLVHCKVVMRKSSMWFKFIWKIDEVRRDRNAPTTSRRMPVKANAFTMTICRWVVLLWMENARVCACTAARKVAW